MRFMIKFITLSLLMFSLLVANNMSWEGKWQVNWLDGAFILTLDQHGSEVNGTYEPAHGKLKGKVKGTVLEAITVNDDGSENKLRLTISDSGESFFGNTKFGDWLTGIRLNPQSKFNTIKVDQSSPLRAFYSFLEMGNAVRAGNYDIKRYLPFIVTENTACRSVANCFACYYYLDRIGYRMAYTLCCRIHFS